MSKILSLTKVMLKNTNFGLETNKKKKKKWQKTLAFFGLLALFLLLAFAVYFLSKDILIALQTQALETFSIQLVMVALSIYLLVTGVITVPIIFYFSKDVENLLALPLKPFEILSAKAITSYFNLLLGASFLVIPFGIAYQAIIQPNLIFIFFYLMAFLILPIIPLALSIAVIVILFTLLPKINNKDLFTYASSILMLIVIFASNLTSINSGQDVTQAVLENVSLLDGVARFLPGLGLLITAVSEFNILALLGSLLLSLALGIGLLYGISRLYFKGALSAQVSSRKKKKKKTGKNKQKPQLQSLIKTDLRNILRTPSLAINYFLPLVLMPAFIFVPLALSSNAEDIQMFRDLGLLARELIKDLDGLTLTPILIIAGFMGTYGLSSFTTLTSTSISREGEAMQTYKSMPLDLMTLVKAKIILGMMAGAIIPLIITLVVSIFLRLNIIAVIIILISIFLALIFSNTSDIILDLMKPKLLWDDETQAVKGNFLSIVPMLASFAVFAFFVFIFIKFNTLYSALFVLILSAAISVFNYKIIIEKFAIEKLDKAIQSL